MILMGDIRQWGKDRSLDSYSTGILQLINIANEVLIRNSDFKTNSLHDFVLSKCSGFFKFV